MLSKLGATWLPPKLCLAHARCSSARYRAVVCVRVPCTCMLSSLLHASCH